MLVTSGALVASSPRTSLGISLVKLSHGTSANRGTCASIGSLRKSVGAGTPRSVGRSSDSPNWGGKG